MRDQVDPSIGTDNSRAEPGYQSTLEESDSVLLATAQMWYARQSLLLRKWALTITDEPDFVRESPRDE